jgi:hypothetical protein
MTVSNAWSRYRTARLPKPARLDRRQEVVADATDQNLQALSLQLSTRQIPEPCEVIETRKNRIHRSCGKLRNRRHARRQKARNFTC